MSIKKLKFDSEKSSQDLISYAKSHKKISTVLKDGQGVTIIRDYGYMVSDKIYHVLIDENKIATARLYGVYSLDLEQTKGAAHVSRMDVEPNFQRLGVATALYDLIETDLERVNSVLEPSDTVSLSGDAKAFWTNRLGITPGQYHSDKHLKMIGSALAMGKPKSIWKRFFGK